MYLPSGCRARVLSLAPGVGCGRETGVCENLVVVYILPISLKARVTPTPRRARHMIFRALSRKAAPGTPLGLARLGRAIAEFGNSKALRRGRVGS
eukprot:scaffold92729_cov66-Phaeocystis_antarctica.AAC.3